MIKGAMDNFHAIFKLLLNDWVFIGIVKVALFQELLSNLVYGRCSGGVLLLGFTRCLYFDAIFECDLGDDLAQVLEAA